MEIDPDLYKSSPQPTFHPLSAHREPSASLSSTKSFSYDGAWFTPVAHTATMRKGSKPELRDTKGRKLGDATFAKLADDITEAAECLRIR
jgi:hypothetical protein